MANYNFNKDISIGESGEQVVVKDLESKGAKFISDNKDYRYDLLMEYKDREIKYEVKTDVYCRTNKDTGNMFIESQCRGKFSGILVTEADWFVTYYKHLNEIWYIRTQELKKLIAKNKDTLKLTQFSGDAGSNTKGWLVPRFKYIKHFKVIKLD